MNTDKISKAEIKSAIKSLRIGKVAGVDSIPPEAIRVGGEVSMEALHSLLNKIWRQEEIPDEWRKGLLVKLPNKRRYHLL